MEVITKKLNYAKLRIVAKHKDKKEYIGRADQESTDKTLKKGRYYLLEFRGVAYQPYVIRRVDKPKNSEWILIK